MAAGFVNNNPAALPGVGTELDAAVRQLLAREPLGGEKLAFGMAMIDGTKTRDADNPTTTRVDVIRDGMPMGRVTGTNKYANSIIGCLAAALTSTATTLRLLTSAEGTELVRRIGSTGTFKVVGPPTAAGTVRALTATYSAVGGGSGANEVQTLAWASQPSAGTFVITIRKPDGSYVSTSAIAYGAILATVQSALDTALGVANGCVVTGTTYAYQTMVFTFSGTGYSATDIDPIQIDYTALTQATAGYTLTETTKGNPVAATVTISALGVNEVQTLVPQYTLTAGTLVLSICDYNGVWRSTPQLDYNTSISALNAILNTMLGSSQVVATAVSGSDITPGFVLTFSGSNYAAKAQTYLARVDMTGTACSGGSGLSGWAVQRTTAGVDGRFTAGSWICPTDGSETPVTLFRSGHMTGVSTLNALLTSIDVIYPELLLAGDVRTAYILFYSGADASLQAYLKTCLRANGGRWVFDDDFGYSAS